MRIIISIVIIILFILLSILLFLNKTNYNYEYIYFDKSSLLAINTIKLNDRENIDIILNSDTCSEKYITSLINKVKEFKININIIQNNKIIKQIDNRNGIIPFLISFEDKDFKIKGNRDWININNNLWLSIYLLTSNSFFLIYFIIPSILLLISTIILIYKNKISLLLSVYIGYAILIFLNQGPFKLAFIENYVFYFIDKYFNHIILIDFLIEKIYIFLCFLIFSIFVIQSILISSVNINKVYNKTKLKKDIDFEKDKRFTIFKDYIYWILISYGFFILSPMIQTMFNVTSKGLGNIFDFFAYLNIFSLLIFFIRIYKQISEMSWRELFLINIIINIIIFLTKIFLPLFASIFVFICFFVIIGSIFKYVKLKKFIIDKHYLIIENTFRSFDSIIKKIIPKSKYGREILINCIAALLISFLLFILDK